jgi:CHAT domain-containing protein/tetratricopeptide (TPR) repeat protein
MFRAALALGSALVPGVPVERQLAGGESHAYLVEAPPGGHLLLRAEQRGIDVILEARLPDGRILAVDTPTGDSGWESLLLPAGTEGRVEARVRSPAKAEKKGFYLLELEELPEDRDRLTAERLGTEAASLFLEGTPEARRGAAARFREAAPIWQRLGRLAEAAGALSCAARIESRLGERRPALELHRRALALWRELGDGKREVETLNAVGVLLWNLGSLREAQTAFGEALDRARSLGDRRAEASALSNLGLIHQSLGELEAALESYDQALALARGLADPGLEARFLVNLGGLHDSRGEPREALAVYARALPLLPALGDRRIEAQTLHNLSVAHLTLGELDEALESAGRSLALFQQEGDRGGQAQSLQHLAALSAHLGDFEKSRDEHAQALALLREVGDRRGEAGALNNLGLVHQKLGDFPEAKALHRQAWDLSRSLEDAVGEAASSTQLASVLLDLGDLGNLGEAARVLDQALALARAAGDRRWIGGALHVRGKLEAARGDLAAAAQRLGEALALRREEGDPIPQIETLVRLATVEVRRGRLGEARAAVDQSLALFEAVRGSIPEPDRRASFLASRRRAFELQVDILMGLHRSEPDRGHALRALDVSERARARALLDLLEEARAVSRGSGRESPETLRAEEVQALLEPGTLLLEYLLGEERSFVWAVERDRVTAHELPARTEIERLGVEVYRGLRTPDSGLGAESRREEDSARRALSELLLGPVAPRLAAARRLVIVADGSLHLIPFSALPVPAGTGPDEEILLERHELISLPSASVLAAQRTALAGRPPAPRGLAIVADPVFGPGLERLPATAVEADRLAGLLPPDQVLRLQGLDASRERVLSGGLSEARVVHLATHGLIDTRTPARSGLALSGSDGFLSLGDIFRLRLGADLVVLSGCETALGRQVRGEGLVGLTQGFLHAGARRLVASLWPVRDRATLELMTRFYTALLEDRLPAGEALRQAQLSLREDRRWRDPYSWAPFVIHGDWLEPPAGEIDRRPAAER